VVVLVSSAFRSTEFVYKWAAPAGSLREREAAGVLLLFRKKNGLEDV